MPVSFTFLADCLAQLDFQFRNLSYVSRAKLLRAPKGYPSPPNDAAEEQERCEKTHFDRGAAPWKQNPVPHPDKILNAMQH